MNIHASTNIYCHLHGKEKTPFCGALFRSPATSRSQTLELHRKQVVERLLQNPIGQGHPQDMPLFGRSPDPTRSSTAVAAFL